MGFLTVGRNFIFRVSLSPLGISTEILGDRWEAAGIRVFDVCSGSGGGKLVSWRGFSKSVEIRLIGIQGNRVLIGHGNMRNGGF